MNFSNEAWHHQKHKFNYGSNKGSWFSCRSQALKYITDIEKQGCFTFKHSVKVAAGKYKCYQTLAKHQAIAVQLSENYSNY